MSIYKYNKTTGELTKIAGGTLYADTPVGTIQAFGGTAIPTGWLACSGQAISRTDYADLFAVIGTYYGSGNGTTTFNVPDLRDRAIMGAGTNGALGASQSAQLPNITGKIDNKSGTFGVTGFSSGTGSFSGAFKGSEAKGAVYTGQQNTSACKVVTFDASYSGASTDIKGNNVYTNNGETRPANVRCNFIIKAKSVGLPADITNEVDTLVNSMLQEYPKRYLADGYILNGDVIRGYGRATVMLYANGQAVIDYACRVSTANMGTNIFGYGISPKIISQVNSSIPLITPKAGGTIMCYRTGSESGVLYPQQDLVHFCGTHNTVQYGADMYWQLARLYEVGAAPGGWPTSQFPLNSYIQGTCYGTFSV